MKTVYLAGPIGGCDYKEANDWRSRVSAALESYGIRGISPLRCEPLMGERYEVASGDPRFGTPRAIASKNLLDVRSCDMTLCYLPRELNDRQPSYGTVGELFWAHGANKPTILVTDCPYLQRHPVVQAASSWSLTTLDEALEVIVGVLGDYARPGQDWNGRAVR